MKYIRLLSVSLIWAIILSCFIYPAIIKTDILSDVIKSLSYIQMIALIMLHLIFQVFFFEKFRIFWQRYQNTKRALEDPPFIYLEHIVCFALFSTILIQLQSKHHFYSSQFYFFIFINSLLLSTFVIGYFFPKKIDSETEIPLDKYSLTERPIQDLEQDLLARGASVQLLFDIIEESCSDIHASVLALYGRRGEGKTSVINMLIQKINKNDSFIVVNYDPWFFKDEEAMLEAFYNELGHAIESQYILPKAISALRKYSNIVSLGLPKTKLDLAFPPVTLRETKTQIEKSIAMLKKPILIVVDDVDRLQAKELIAIMRLVHLNSRFIRTTFLLVCDYEVIIKTLSKDEQLAREFIEKVVQKQYSLPPPTQKCLNDYVDYTLENILLENGLPEHQLNEFGKEFNGYYHRYIWRIIHNLRIAKRYIHALKMIIPELHSEINLCDLVAIEAIRAIFPDVIEDMGQNPWYYIDPGSRGLTEVHPAFPHRQDEHAREYKIKEHLEQLTEGSLYKEPILGILKSLFPRIREAYDEHFSGIGNDAEFTKRRILYFPVFQRYITQTIPEGQISLNIIPKVLNDWSRYASNQQNEMIEQGYLDIILNGELLPFFKTMHKISEKIGDELSRVLIKLISNNTKQLSLEGTEDMWQSEFDQAVLLVSDLLKNVSVREERKRIVKDTIFDTDSKLFLSSFLGHLYQTARKKNDNLLHEILSDGEIKEKSLVIFKKYFIEEKRDIFNEIANRRQRVILLYNWITHWRTNEIEPDKEVKAYIISQINEDIENLPIFLEDIMKQETDGEWQLQSGLYLLLYDKKELGDIVKRSIDESALSNNRELLIAFLKAINKVNSKN